MTARALAAALGLVVAASGALPAGARAAVPTPLANADGWAAQPPGRDRDRILERWLPGATLPELMWLLRRGPEQLGGIEIELAGRALDRTPPIRTALRRRLIARLLTLDPRRARKRFGALADVVAAVPLAPRASAFRVGVLAPVAGAYADYAAALTAGLETALAPEAAASLPAEVRAWDTGEDDAPRAVAALDSSTQGAGVLVGELTSIPTEIIAAGARVYGIALVSPTAADESIGAMGPGVFQVGPSGYQRGERLARAMALGDRRVGLLTSTASNPAFAAGFMDAAQAAGAEVVSRATYAPGSTSFRAEVRELTANKVDVLLWDGEPREADALLRQLAHDRASMRICGGAALTPESHHAEMHFLLEGVQYVAEEWSLPAGLRAALDSASSARSGQAASPVFVRGWLAGRAIRAALDAGALCPEEIAGELAKRRAHGGYLSAHGFLEPGIPGLELPVYTVSRGKSVAVTE